MISILFPKGNWEQKVICEYVFRQNQNFDPLRIGCTTT